MKALPYLDMHMMDENARIAAIGKQAMTEKQIVGIFVDYDGTKGTRYIRKLTERFPGIRIIYRGPGPVEGVEFIKVGPAKEGVNATT